MKKHVFVVLFVINYFMGNAQSGFAQYFMKNGFIFNNLCLTTGAGAETVMACSSYSAANNNYLSIIKTDSVFNSISGIIWQKFYKTNTLSFVPVKMITHSDGSYIVELIDTVGFNEIQLWKVTSTGTVQWIKQFYANLFSLNKYPLIVLPGGSIYVVHPSSDSLCVKKVSSGGNLISETRYSGLSAGLITPRSACYHDTSLYIGGYDASSSNAFLLRTDTLGTIKWTNLINNTSNASLNMVPVLTGGIMFSTISSSFPTRAGRFNRTGQLLWQKEFVNDTFNIVASGVKNKLYLLKEKNNATSIVALDTSGTLAYSKSTYSYFMNKKFEAIDMAHRGFNISSTNNTDKISLTRIAPQGSACNGAYSPTIALTNVTFSTTPLALFTTSASISFTNVTYTLQTTGSFQPIGCSPAGVSNIQLVYDISVYPNPAKDLLTIEGSDGYFNKFSVFNALGQLMISDIMPEPEAKLIINVSNLEQGIYLLQTESTNGNVFNKNIVIVR